MLTFIAASLVAASGPVLAADRYISRLLEPIGYHAPLLQLIWVVGGLPVTTLLVLVAASGFFGKRPAHWSVLAIFIGGSVVELMVKHWVATPFPPNVAAPALYGQIVAWTNIEPSAVFSAIGSLTHSPAVHHASTTFLRGSFPSGHVFRITFAYGLILADVWRIALVVLAAFAVVATGGHWPWDTVGGFLLGSAGLVLAKARMSTHRGIA